MSSSLSDASSLTRLSIGTDVLTSSGAFHYRARQMTTAVFAFIAGFAAYAVIDRVYRQIQRRRVLARLQGILTFESRREHQELRIARLPD